MKKLLFLLLIGTSLKSIAQDPQLFDTVWTLSQLNLGGNVTSPSDPIHIGELTFEETENILSVTNVECDKIFNGDFTSFNATTFELFDFVDPFGFDCNNDTAFDFLEIHSFFYKSDPTDDPLNPFTYEITTSGDESTLVITNGNGDIATYGNFSLSISDNLSRSTKLIYNAENQYISFLGLEQETFLSIHNLNGQKLLDATVSPSETVNVSLLPKGIYFATVSNSDNQRMSKKFVKF